MRAVRHHREGLRGFEARDDEIERVKAGPEAPAGSMLDEPSSGLPTSCTSIPFVGDATWEVLSDRSGPAMIDLIFGWSGSTTTWCRWRSIHSGVHLDEGLEVFERWRR